MRKIGIRNIEHIGRFVIPIEIYNSLGISKGDSLIISLGEIFHEGREIKCISLKKKEENCVICGKPSSQDPEQNITYRGKGVCNECIALIKEI